MNSGSSALAIASNDGRKIALRLLAGLLTLGVSFFPTGLSAAAPPPITVVLDQVGHSVEEFWQRFPRVTCTESVSQMKLDTKNRVMRQNRAEFDYLVALGMDGAEPVVEETRTQKATKEDKAPPVPLLVTKGFSTMLLVFHPQFQPDFDYTVMPDEMVDGKMLHRVDFTHIGGSPTPSVLQVRDQIYPLEWKGTAWIDPDTWAVVKIKTALKESMEKVGLKTLGSEVAYRPVKYDESGEAYWLPDTATVEAETLRQHWRNVHRFTAFHKFQVDVKFEAEIPKEGSN